MIKSNLSLYWKCQLLGWSVASLYWMLSGWMRGPFDWGLGLLQFVTDVAMYVFITHLYRNFALRMRWPTLSLKQLVTRLVAAIPIMAICYGVATILKVHVLRQFFSNGTDQSLEEFVRSDGLTILVAGVRLMAIWLLAYHLYHYAKREIKLAELNSKLELSTLEAQLDTLATQLNPHFLFNSLNTIKSLVFTRPESAARGIDLLSELLRSGLSHSSQQELKLEEELDLVRDYLELQHLRFDEKLQVQYGLDDSLSQLTIPRMSIQTLVENAVKHGVSSRKDGGKVAIFTSKMPNHARIQVWSPNVKMEENPVNGIGLANLRKRLELTYGGKADFRLIRKDDQICAELSIPLP